MEHRCDTDLCTKVVFIGRDRQHRLGRCLKQQVVDHLFVLVGNVGDRARQREHDMEIASWQQLGFTIREPVTSRATLTLQTMPVAARVVSDMRVPAGTVLASRNMTASWRSHASHGRAAVLHRSMALITFNCARLTWSRLASRQAGPCSRKMSATSKAGWDIGQTRYVCRFFLFGLPHLLVRLSSGLSMPAIMPVATNA